MTGSPAVSPSSTGRTALALVTAALLLATLGLASLYAPTEEVMGIAQKIFYFHVPAAYSMYIGFGIAAVGSAVYLKKRSDAWEAWAVAGAEVGVLFCAIVLVTGPLWARKAWGVYWAWEPRLTTTLLAGMVFTSYIALRSFGGIGEAERKFAAGLAIVGLVDLPIIHYSVQRWSGQHPRVIQGGGMTPEMWVTLVTGCLAFTCLSVLLIWTRARIERMRQITREAELDAAHGGLLEDS